MSAPVFGTPIYSDVGVTYTPTISGGSWLAALPATNVQDRRLSKVARSSSAAVADTQMEFNLQTARSIRVLASLLPNISKTGASVRWRCFSASPVFKSQTVGDATWTAVGTPTRSAASFASADNVDLDLLGDDSGAAVEYYYKAISFTGDGVKAVRFRVARSSAYGAHLVGIWDNTAAAFILEIRIDFTIATPVFSVLGGHGTIVSTAARGDGSYDVLCTTASATAANTNRVYVQPAQGAAGDTASFYCGDIVAWNATSDQQLDDSGFIDAWPSGVTAEDAEGLNVWSIHVLSTAVSAQHVLKEVSDASNADAYIDVARVAICGGWQPANVGISYGAKTGWEDDSVRSNTEGGAAIYVERSRRRTMSGVIRHISESDAYNTALGMQHRLGISRPFVWVENPEGTAALQYRRNYLATYKELSALEQAYYSALDFGFNIVEEL